MDDYADDELNPQPFWLKQTGRGNREGKRVTRWLPFFSYGEANHHQIEESGSGWTGE